MADSTRKIITICLIGCIAAVWQPVNTVAETPDDSLQPQGLNHAGIYALKQLDPSLTGDGVKFAIISRSITYIDGKPQNDYRPAVGHNCFVPEQFTFHDQNELPAGTSAHSTAICSILFGRDPNAFNRQLGNFYYQGAAPEAQADIYEFWHFLINNVFPHSSPDANILTADVGNQFQDWWSRGIEAMAEHYGTIVVAGIGNGLNAYDPPLYPAAAANVIGVGVIDSVNTKNLADELANFALAYPQHSSFGPTDDGRCKPDIVAPGNCLAADANDPNRYEPTGTWSSFSTPLVAGTVGLLVQKAQQDPDLALALSSDGGNCVIKALLMNSATKLPYWHKGRLQTDDDHLVPLDYTQGAGMLNAVGAYENLIAGRNQPNDVPSAGWDLNRLGSDATAQNIYKITIPQPSDKVITATAVWNKHYSNVYPFEPAPQNDANLRLELWAVEHNNPDADYLLDYSDSNADNVEHIYTVADVNYTNYELIVSYSDTDEPNQPGAGQPYALAWNLSDAPDSNDILWYDLNADGIVNELDSLVLLNNLLTAIKAPESNILGDINADGTIDFMDFVILMGQAKRRADWYKD